MCLLTKRKEHAPFGAPLCAVLSFILAFAFGPASALAVPVATQADAGLAAQAAVPSEGVSGRCGFCTWTLSASGELVIAPIPGEDGVLTLGDGESSFPWLKYAQDIKTATVKPGVSSDVSLAGMFEECSALASLDLSGLDTSTVTDFSRMFSYCTSLTTLDLSTFDTSSATRMDDMFAWCLSLATLDISSFDTSNVWDMESMFRGCSALTSFSYPVFDTSRAELTSEMFFGCSSLVSLALSGLDLTNVLKMDGMFEGCSSLVSLDLSNLNAAGVADMPFIFRGCTSLASLNLSGLNAPDLTSTANMFEGCSSLVSVNLSSSNLSSLTDMSKMFYGCSSLASLDLSMLDATQVTSMAEMFGGCSSLAMLKLPSRMSSVLEDISGMFYGCNALATVDLASLDTSKVKDMGRLFYGCSSLASLDLSTFETSSVEKMNEMFGGCNALTSLDLTSFDTSKTTSMWRMFCVCPALVSLDLSTFDTSKANLHEMFYTCPSLTQVKLGTGFSFRGSSELHSGSLPPGGVWKSAATGKIYTADVIASKRGNIADTYVKVDLRSSAQVPVLPDQVSYLKEKSGLSDLEDDWYLQTGPNRGAFDDGTLYLQYVVSKNLMQGYRNDNGVVVAFGPNDRVSRAQVATILYRFANPDSIDTTDKEAMVRVANKSGMPDVASGQYYTAAVNWCVANGVVNGKKDEAGKAYFDPDGAVTRQELATMIGRLCVDVLEEPPAKGVSLSRFKDESYIEDYAREHVAFCYAKRIVGGVGDTGNFEPLSTATRTQMAKMISVTARGVLGGQA